MNRNDDIWIDAEPEPADDPLYDPLPPSADMLEGTDWVLDKWQAERTRWGNDPWSGALPTFDEALGAWTPHVAPMEAPYRAALAHRKRFELAVGAHPEKLSRDEMRAAWQRAEGGAR